MSGEKQVLGSGNPTYLGDRGLVYDALNVFSAVSIKETGALTFLFSLVYRWDTGSHQIISPVEKPIIMSIWLGLFVTKLTSWLKQ